MTGAERGFLLLGCHLGQPDRHPLTLVQLRELGNRVRQCRRITQDREMEQHDLIGLGYGEEMAWRILTLLSQEGLLHSYISRGKRLGCTPITRISDGFPRQFRNRLGMDCPVCLWAKGDLSLLDLPGVALVGSRNLEKGNLAFARRLGEEAARQGYVLISGNARGADKAAQDACLDSGGSVISIVADRLCDKEERAQVLYLSEDGFDEAFSAWRALSRNRLIHSLGSRTFVAQCSLETGGTWSGTVQNLRNRHTQVLCYNDGSQAVSRLCQMGAVAIETEQLTDLSALPVLEPNLFEQY